MLLTHAHALLRHCGRRRASATALHAKKRKAKSKEPLKRAELPKGAARPKLIVFDLDNTLWQPELYQMRGKKPKANKDIKLTAGALDALHDLAGDGWEKTQAAVHYVITAILPLPSQPGTEQYWDVRLRRRWFDDDED